MKNSSVHLSKLLFCNFIREDMNERRKNMVLKAFAILDKTGDGRITFEDVKNIYDVTGSSDFTERRLTKEQIVSNFLN